MKELKFSQVWPEKMGELAGKETNFSAKIIACLHFCNKIGKSIDPYTMNNQNHINKVMNFEYLEKRHTIRKGKKYKDGQIVRPMSIDSNGDSFPFAPDMNIVSVQDIEIRRGINHKYFDLLIDGDLKWGNAFGNLLNFDMDKFIVNDGFADVNDFVKYFNEYFNEGFHGQILHFTDLRY